ncbi:MAG: hypothetical protein QM645_09935 [Asticcacaulis sp.]
MRSVIKVFAALSFVLAPVAMAPAVHAAHLPFDSVTQKPLTPAAQLTADLNGDGLKDDIWFSHNGQDRLNLHVRFSGSALGDDMYDHIVTGLDVAQAHQLQSAPAGTYRLDCGDFSSACAQDAVHTAHDGLILSLDEGLTILIHWNGETFEQDFVASNTVRMQRAMAVRFALNL